MSEPSVEEIVLAYESAKAMGLPQNYIGHEHADALIADWRKRGEALKETDRALRSVRKNIPEGAQTAFTIIDAALTPQQPPPQAP